MPSYPSATPHCLKALRRVRTGSATGNLPRRRLRVIILVSPSERLGPSRSDRIGTSGLRVQQPLANATVTLQVLRLLASKNTVPELQHKRCSTSVTSPFLPSQHIQIRPKQDNIAQGRTPIPTLVDISDLEGDDIVIIVMGPPGSGKSTFICAASGLDSNEVDDASESSPSQATTTFWDHACKRRVVLVDTPSFDNTSEPTLDTLRMTLYSLVSSKNEKIHVAAILYFHRITDNRMAGSPLKNLRVFERLCKSNDLDKVYFTTTMWDEIEPSVGGRRLAALREEYWKSMIAQGAQTARCRRDDDSSRRLIQQIILSRVQSSLKLANPSILPQSKEPVMAQAFSRFSELVGTGGQKVDDSVTTTTGSADVSKAATRPTTEGGIHSKSDLSKHPASERQIPNSADRRFILLRHGQVYYSHGGMRHSPNPFSAKGYHSDNHTWMRSSFNIILFGEASVGKSSVINLIAEEDVANTSRASWECTLESKQYSLNVAKKTFTIWETVGLGEPVFSASNCLGAISKTYALIKQLEAQGGLDLLLFCIPGSRVTATMQSNYRLFFEVLCDSRIPIAAVVTHLEDEERMEDWWDRNEKYFSRGGLRFCGHACVTGKQGHSKAAEGRSALELLLLCYDDKGRYPMPPASTWFSGFLERLSSVPRSRELKEKQKDLERLLRKRCMMDSAEARRLAEALARSSG